MELNVETRAKVDKLAHELLKNGVVASRVDAEKRAMEIIGVSLKEDMKEEKSKEDENMNAEFSKMIEEHNARIMKEFVLVKQKMDEMVNEINKMNSEIGRVNEELRKRPAVPVAERAIEGADKSKNEAIGPKQEQDDKKAAEVKEVRMNEPASHTMAALNEKNERGSFDQGAKSEHPRSGGYAPKDVAIEKMFYFGKK